MIPWLESDTPFPPVDEALTEQQGAAGLLAAGADLSPARLLMAYRRGIFPWYAEGQPILWWSTDPRMVLYTEEFVISHSLKKKLKKIEKSRRTDGIWQVRFDTAFAAVMQACAGPRSYGGGTWITPEIIDGYTGLHQEGYAHSAELWLNGELVGGAYGVCIGKMFFGESMFAHTSDASKIALAYLVHFLKSQGVQMIDCQQDTSHLASLGARPILREKFIQHLKKAVAEANIEDWTPQPIFSAGDEN